MSISRHNFSWKWNALLAKLSRSRQPHKTLPLFLQIHSSVGAVAIDDFTLPPVLRSISSSSSSLGNPLAVGSSIHALSLKLGLVSNLFVASALIFFYFSVSTVPNAALLFDEMSQRDAVLWTSMLSGYAHSGHPHSAISIFRDMVRHTVELDEAVLVSLLLACGQLGRIRQGRTVHGFAVRRQFGLPLNLGNALIDLYVKCGAFAAAEAVFGRMPERDVISWSALILGHGLNGRADAALQLFEEMFDEGVVKPNSVTFLGVLTACVHSGMVEKAWELFDTMKQFGVRPELKHYACMVDVLGRAGHLAKAEKLVEDMPVEPDEAVLGALLSSCRVHGDVEVGERVARRLMDMRPDKSGYYVILANIYSDVGRFDDAERVRGFMRQMDVRKVIGLTSIEMDGFSTESCRLFGKGGSSL